MSISVEKYQLAKQEALKYFEKTSIVLTQEEIDNLEVADFGLGELDTIGVELVTYANTQRVCAKEVILFPWQICPEHRHLNVLYDGGKEETFRCRWGKVYLYVDGVSAAEPNAKVPDHRKQHFTVWHEIVLNPGDQFTVGGDRLHWFQAGPEGAVLSEFSTPSTDEFDIFTDPDVSRIPVIV